MYLSSEHISSKVMITIGVFLNKHDFSKSGEVFAKVEGYYTLLYLTYQSVHDNI